MFDMEWITHMCTWYTATDPFGDDEELDGEYDGDEYYGDEYDGYEILEEDEDIEKPEGNGKETYWGFEIN